MYHNTTKQKGEILENFKAKAQTQDDKILEYFRDRRGAKITPDAIWMSIFDTTSVPLTSIRRSINSLTNQGKLIKTDVQQQGMYGRPVYCWILK